MITWFAANLGTIAVPIVLLAVVAAIIAGMRRDRRMGKNSCGVRCGGCGGSCSGCAGCGGCHG